MSALSSTTVDTTSLMHYLSAWFCTIMRYSTDVVAVKKVNFLTSCSHVSPFAL